MEILKTIAMILAISITVICCSEDSARMEELEPKYVGNSVPFSQFSEIGSPETLSGTTSKRWRVYFDKGDFIFVTEKSTNIVMAVYDGRYSL